MIEKSCGTIPYTVKDGTIYYLLVKALDDGYCGFPKGHVQTNETEIETAIRETLEETSVSVNIISDIHYDIFYQMDNGNQKTVVYFLAEFKDQVPKRNNDFEDFDYFILPFDEAHQYLTFENTRQLLKMANDFLTSTAKQGLLLREKGDRVSGG